MTQNLHDGRESCHIGYKVTYFGEFAYSNNSSIRKSVNFVMFLSPWEIHSRFRSTIQWQMFLLVSGRHVGAHPDGLPTSFAGSTPLSRWPFWKRSRPWERGWWAPAWRLHTNVYKIWVKKFLRKSCLRKSAVTWILAWGFEHFPYFFSQITEFIYWTVLIFISIYFKNTENQQYADHIQSSRLNQPIAFNVVAISL